MLLEKQTAGAEFGSWGKHSLSADPSFLSRQDSWDGHCGEMSGTALSKVTLCWKGLEVREQLSVQCSDAGTGVKPVPLP